MKILKYKAEQFNANNAHQICLDLETQLGVNLMNHDTNNPNEVQGYINTSGDGDIEVCLYEQEDVDAINARPQTHTEEVIVEKNGKEKKGLRTYQTRSNVPLKKCGLSDEILIQKCNNYFVDIKGFKHH
jgi:hypothetical protein